MEPPSCWRVATMRRPSGVMSKEPHIADVARGERCPARVFQENCCGTVSANARTPVADTDQELGAVEALDTSSLGSPTIASARAFRRSS